MHDSFPKISKWMDFEYFSNLLLRNGIKEYYSILGLNISKFFLELGKRRFNRNTNF